MRSSASVEIRGSTMAVSSERSSGHSVSGELATPPRALARAGAPSVFAMVIRRMLAEQLSQNVLHLRFDDHALPLPQSQRNGVIAAAEKANHPTATDSA